MKLSILVTTAVLAFAATDVSSGQSTTSSKAPASQPNNNSAVAQRAKSILDKAIDIYHKAPALTDTLDITVEVPQAGKQSMRFDLAMDEHGNSSIVSSTLLIVVKDNNVFIQDTKFPKKYVQIEVTDSLAEAMAPTRIGLPFQYAMRGDERPSFDDLLQAISPGAATGMVVTKVEDARAEDGGRRQVIHLKAPSGTLQIHVDPATSFLRQVIMEQGEEGEAQHATVTIDLDPKTYQSLPEKISFDTIGKRRVLGMDDLRLSIGDEAPDFTLESNDGQTISLSKLRGNVVVLDFWATWCGPCIRGLPMLDEFNQWVKTSGKPIKVFAVNVWERHQSADQRKSAALGFWQSRNFSMPTLLDLESSVATAYGFQSIPTTIIVAPDGTIAVMHNSLQPNMVEMLKEETAEALAGSPAGRPTSG